MDEEKEFLEETKKQISIEQMELLLAELGGEPQTQGDIIKCRTICHCGDSHKLYYYNNTRLFRCYTDCPEDSFDIFELIKKIKKREQSNWNLPQSLNYVLHYFGLAPKNRNFDSNDVELEDWKILNNYNKNTSQEEDKQKIELQIYDSSILKFLPHPRIIPWEKEHITREVMESRGICYNPSSQGIVIPHYNKNGELVGIRERTLIKENEANGKYKPAIINRQMYNHPLGFNLYNLNFSKNNIKIIKKAILFVGEKSCLLYASYFGLENDISVACCGSSLINYQVNLLLDLGVEEIIIAYDKQFKEVGDEEWQRWTKKLTSFHDKYGAKVQISYIFDKEKLLQYKDSPIDRGMDIFLKLFKERIRI